MGKKPAAAKKKTETAQEEKPEEPSEEVWTCLECGYENPAEEQACLACEAPRQAGAGGGTDDSFKNIVVGSVTSLEKVKEKLSLLKVDVGKADPLSIVTNAGNVKEGSRVVVAMVGAVVADEEVKKASIQGHPSEGMLCDGPMLGWVGGGAGAAALVPESFALGSAPPSSRPRTDGK
mmetsp:Transcript_33239/g.74080  ORF Transcript_33239/g.74080 Transcript_33239/m.74080 type:complete len:177 (+) Transcript_33239:96-626(+)